MKYITMTDTDVGTTKETNQDSILMKAARTRCGSIILAAVCDGMGGLEKGELASAEAVKTLSSWFDRKVPEWTANVSWKEIADDWNTTIHKLNERLIAYGEKEGVSLGTTLSAMLIHGGEYLIGHVGDSRIYCIGRDIKCLTKDQTVVAREVMYGKLTPEQAKHDPRRNVLLQCIGASKNVIPQFILGTVERNSTYLLCSDGFRHEISEGEMWEQLNPEIAKDKEKMQKNARFLIDTVKERRERDNISVALIRTID